MPATTERRRATPLATRNTRDNAATRGAWLRPPKSSPNANSAMDLVAAAARRSQALQGLRPLEPRTTRSAAELRDGGLRRSRIRYPRQAYLRQHSRTKTRAPAARPRYRADRRR